MAYCCRLEEDLPNRRTGAENKAVRIEARWTAVAMVTLCVALIGHAQYRDSDRSGVPPTSAKAPAPEARVDINRASVEELMKVPGLARTWAGRIVRYRPYRSKQELLDRGIVTPEVYERIKDFVIARRK